MAAHPFPKPSRCTRALDGAGHPPSPTPHQDPVEPPKHRHDPRAASRPPTDVRFLTPPARPRAFDATRWPPRSCLMILEKEGPARKEDTVAVSRNRRKGKIHTRLRACTKLGEVLHPKKKKDPQAPHGPVGTCTDAAASVEDAPPATAAAAAADAVAADSVAWGGAREASSSCSPSE